MKYTICITFCQIKEKIGETDQIHVIIKDPSTLVTRVTLKVLNQPVINPSQMPLAKRGQLL